MHESHNIPGETEGAHGVILQINGTAILIGFILRGKAGGHFGNFLPCEVADQVDLMGPQVSQNAVMSQFHLEEPGVSGAVNAPGLRSGMGKPALDIEDFTDGSL